MINFEFGKLRSDYVFITKITPQYIYVVCDRNMKSYGSGEEAIHFEHTVKKVPIHRSVYSRFSKSNPLREFSTPRLTSLNLYGDDIISIELQQFNYKTHGFDSPKSWSGVFDQSIDLIEKRITYYIGKGHNVYMNGESIFWISKVHNKENPAYVQLNKEGSLRLYYARAIKLFRIGASRLDLLSLMQGQHTASESDLPKTESDEANQIGKGNLTIPVLNGKIMAFVPNPSAPAEDQIVAFSPLLESKKVRGASGGMVTVNHEERAAYALGSVDSPVLANVDFALHSAKMIGKLYGNEAMEFLDIPTILKTADVVNLKRLSKASRKNMPINRTAFDCIAWLLGYIYREKNMMNLQSLNRAFRYTMSNGFIRQSDIDFAKDLTTANGSEKVIRLRTDRVNKTLETLNTKDLTIFQKMELLKKERIILSQEENEEFEKILENNVA
jgi:hypothetical protein